MDRGKTAVQEKINFMSSVFFTVFIQKKDEKTSFFQK